MCHQPFQAALCYVCSKKCSLEDIHLCLVRTTNCLFARHRKKKTIQLFYCVGLMSFVKQMRCMLVTMRRGNGKIISKCLPDDIIFVT